MKLSRVIGALFGVAGVCAAALCVHLAFDKMHASPELVEQPESARGQVEILMEAVSNNDYATAGSVIQGNPVFGADREPADRVSALIWDAFVESVSYELVGELYATDSGVALDIMISALDIDSVTVNLRQRAQTLLEQRIAEAEDTDQIYDENNEYREDFVMGALRDAAKDALREDADTISWEITLNLIYEDGQWWVMPESQLLQAISGGILKG